MEFKSAFDASSIEPGSGSAAYFNWCGQPMAGKSQRWVIDQTIALKTTRGFKPIPRQTKRKSTTTQI